MLKTSYEASGTVLTCAVAINTEQTYSETTGKEGIAIKEHALGRERLNARAKSRNEKTDETRQRILNESIKLFVEQGYDKTTTRQIVLNSGILNGSLYNIYKSKDDIFKDIAQIAFKEASALMDDVLGPDASSEQILCFPTCIQIYASFRSPRIAELLSVAHTKWEILQSAMSFYKRWMTDRPELWADMLDDPLLDLKLTAYSGALGSILKTIAERSLPLSESTCMKYMCSVELRTFGFDDTLDTTFIDRIISEFESRDIEICNIRI